jgi:hypothetical protein
MGERWGDIFPTQFAIHCISLGFVVVTSIRYFTPDFLYGTYGKQQGLEVISGLFKDFTVYSACIILQFVCCPH